MIDKSCGPSLVSLDHPDLASLSLHSMMSAVVWMMDQASPCKLQEIDF